MSSYKPRNTKDCPHATEARNRGTDGFALTGSGGNPGDTLSSASQPPKPHSEFLCVSPPTPAPGPWRFTTAGRPNQYTMQSNQGKKQMKRTFISRTKIVQIKAQQWCISQIQNRSRYAQKGFHPGIRYSFQMVCFLKRFPRPSRADRPRPPR